MTSYLDVKSARAVHSGHLKRDVRTARRWEQTMGLPVHRLPGHRGHSVFAYAAEIDAWLKSANPNAKPPPDPVVPLTTGATIAPRRGWRLWTVIPAAALMLVMDNAVAPSGG